MNEKKRASKVKRIFDKGMDGTKAHGKAEQILNVTFSEIQNINSCAICESAINGGVYMLKEIPRIH